MVNSAAVGTLAPQLAALGRGGPCLGLVVQQGDGGPHHRGGGGHQVVPAPAERLADDEVALGLLGPVGAGPFFASLASRCRSRAALISAAVSGCNASIACRLTSTRSPSASRNDQSSSQAPRRSRS